MPNSKCRILGALEEPHYFLKFISDISSGIELIPYLIGVFALDFFNT